MPRLTTLAVCVLTAATPLLAAADDDLTALRAELEKQRQELEALKSTSLEKEVEQQNEPVLRAYGFMDLGLQKMFMKENSLGTAIIQSDSSTFVLGNLNLYLDAQPWEGWRGLLEVRLTNAPNGSDVFGVPGSPYQRTNTTVLDPTSSNGGWSQIRWGALVLERAHIDWRYSDYLTIRAGLFLTPAGIWNVDHGTPTLIALQAPQFLVIELFPPRQIGVQLFGTHHFAPWALEYVAYVSNGRTSGQLDPSEGKAIGGRAVLRQTGATRLSLGTSFYLNHFADEKRELVVEGGESVIERTDTVSYDEQVFGLDAAVDVGPLRLRTEGVFRRVVYDEGKRNLWYGFSGFYMSNRWEADAYTLAAYQLPWLGLEPFANFEVQRTPNMLGEGLMTPSVGFNVHFNAATTLKVQVARTYFWGDWASSDTNFTFAATRVVLAF